MVFAELIRRFPTMTLADPSPVRIRAFHQRAYPSSLGPASTLRRPRGAVSASPRVCDSPSKAFADLHAEGRGIPGIV